MDDENFEVLLHQNQYTSTFLYSFDNIQSAEDMIKQNFPEFVKVESHEAVLSFLFRT